MGNAVAKVDPCGLPPPLTQCIDEKDLRPMLSRWKLAEISSLKTALLEEFRVRHQQPSKQKFSFEAEVSWATFFHAFEDIADRVEERVKQSARQSFHSSCHEYAMIRKERALLEDGSLAPLNDDDELLPEMQSVAAEQSSSLAAKAADKPQKPEKQLGPAHKWRYSVASTGSGSEDKEEAMQKMLTARMSSMGEASDADLSSLIADDDPAHGWGSDPAAGGNGAGALEKRPVPVRKKWNPAVISPVFFGYTLAKAAQEDERQLRARRARRLEESKWDNTDLERKESEYSVQRDLAETKFAEHVRAIEKLARQRQLAREKRFETRLEKEEELADSPEGLKAFQKHWFEEEGRIAQQEQQDDYTKNNVANIPELKELHRISEELRELREEKAFLLNRPRGRALRRKFKKLHKQTQVLVQECEAKLEEATAIYEKLKKNKGTPKGVLIMGEGDVKRAQNALDRASDDCARYKANFERAEGLAAREEQCAELFEGVSKARPVSATGRGHEPALATSTVNSRAVEMANIMELCTLMCLASGEKLATRLEWLFQQFNKATYLEHGVRGGTIPVDASNGNEEDDTSVDDVAGASSGTAASLEEQGGGSAQALTEALPQLPVVVERPLTVNNLFFLLDFVVRALRKLGGVHRPVSKYELQALATEAINTHGTLPTISVAVKTTSPPSAMGAHPVDVAQAQAQAEESRVPSTPSLVQHSAGQDGNADAARISSSESRSPESERAVPPDQNTAATGATTSARTETPEAASSSGSGAEQVQNGRQDHGSTDEVGHGAIRRNASPGNDAVNTEVELGLIPQAEGFYADGPPPLEALDATAPTVLGSFGFVDWASKMIRQSPALSALFGVVAFNDSVCDYQAQHMQLSHQLARGFISLPAYYRLLNQRLLHHHECLSRLNRKDFHRRALALGLDDPLKTDYSAGNDMKKKNEDAVVPLSHGGRIGDLAHYSNEVASRATRKIQMHFRARRGRQAHRLFQNRDALLQAQEEAKRREARKVRKKIQKMEKSKDPIKKMKWEATIRMFQVKLQAQPENAGTVFDRETTLKRMQAEEIAAKWKLLEKKFGKMAEDNNLTPAAITLYRAAIASKPPEPFKPPATERLRSLLGGQPYPQEPNGAVFGEDEEEACARVEYAQPNPSRTAFYKRLRNFRRWMTDKKANDILAETPNKRLFIRRYSTMKPVAMTQFFARHYRFTQQQAQELCQFAENIIRTDLESGMQRSSIELQISKREEGLRRAVHGLSLAQVRAAAREIRTERNQEAVRGDADAGEVAVAKRTAETELLVKKLSDEVEERRVHMNRVRAQLEHAEGQLREVQRRLLARKTATGDRIAEEKLLTIDPKFRLDWMTRLGAIVRSGAGMDPSTATSNVGQGASDTASAVRRERESARHQELQALLSDFQRCATSYSKLIVQEFFLPESQKLIRAAERRKTDTGLGFKATFEVHHIRFVVQLDYDGIFDGDHTNAMKCGGNALRASKTLFVSNLPGVMVPLQACVDYAGFRVLATAVAPIVAVEKSASTGDTLKTTKRLVHGTPDRGFHMVKDTSPEFGAIIQSIGDCLKLGRHNVLGKEDVDTTATEIAADVELYVTVEMEGVEEAARLEGVPAITDVAQTAVAEEATGGQIAPSGSITTLALLATKDEDLHHPSLDEGGGQDHARPKSLVVLNTSNMLPSEPASETPHLDQSTRQMSIYWRQFRPEFLSRFASRFRLSADAGRSITLGAPGCWEELEKAREATRVLLNEVVPEFANEIARKWYDIDYFAINWSAECHVRGLNCRHLGILRNKFWIRLEGSCDAVFDEYHLLTTADWRKDISPGATLKVTGREPDARTQTFVACQTNSKRRIGLQEEHFTDKACPVDKPIRAAAGINRTARSGWVAVERNSDRVRQSLLLELVARSVKIILRRASLQAAELCGYNSEESFKDIAVAILNKITGVSPGSLDWWTEEVLQVLSTKFGSRSVCSSERRNLLEASTVFLYHLVRRVANDFAFDLLADTWQRFSAQPLGFRFEAGDVCNLGARAELNAEGLFAYSTAMVLLGKADAARSKSYRSTILADGPTAYWPLTEELGSLFARSLVGMKDGDPECRGRYSRAIRYRVPGCIKSDAGPTGPKACGFHKDAQARVEVPPSESINPTGPHDHFSVEVWARCEIGSCGLSQLRVVVATGRFRLCVDRHDHWAFAVYCTNIAAERVVVHKSETVEEDRWYHVSGSYDGTMIRLYIDGVLQQQLNVRNEEQEKAQKRNLEMASTLQKYADDEVAELEAAADEAQRIVVDQLKQPAEKEEFTRKAVAMAHQSNVAAKERAARRQSEIENLRQKHIAETRAVLERAVQESEAAEAQASEKHEAALAKHLKLQAEQEQAEAAAASGDQAATALAAGAVAAVLRAETELQQLSQDLDAARAAVKIAREQLETPIEGPSEEVLLQELQDLQNNAGGKSSKVEKKRRRKKKSRSKSGKKENSDDADSDSSSSSSSADDNGILSIFEAKAKIRKELIRALREEKQKKVRDKYLILNENLRNHGQVALDAGRARGAQPLRIGCDSKAGNDGSKFFVGSICHVAVYRRALTPHEVFTHRTIAMLNLTVEANRLYGLAAKHFKDALVATPRDSQVLRGFARALCNQFPYVDTASGDDALDAIHDDDFDAADSAAMKAYKHSLEVAVEEFQTQRNAAGIAAILFEIPTRFFYWDVLGTTWNALVAVSKKFLDHESLRLATLPEKFGLVRPGASRDKIALAASIFQAAARGEPLVFDKDNGRQATDWISDLESAELVCEIVRRVQTGIDLRSLDLRPFKDSLSETDFFTLTDNLRTVQCFDVAGCSTFSHTALLKLGQRAMFLEELVLDNVTEVDDGVLRALVQCKKLQKLSLMKCQQITDGGVEHIAVGLPSLVSLNFSYCPYISDVSLEMLGRHIKGMMELDVSFCVAITSKGLKAMVRHGTPSLVKLKLAGCGRVDGDGVNVVSTHYSNLEELDLSFLHKVSSPAIRLAFHNLLELKHVRLTDLHLLRDDVFSYDELDGRPGPQRFMLSKLRTLSVANCSKLSSVAVKHLAARATELESLDLSGCDDVDDKAIGFLTVDSERQTPRNRSLQVLRMNFCGKLTDATLRGVADALPDLQELCMCGCPQLSDAAFQYIARRMGCLQVLNVSHCRRITDEAVQLLSERLWLEEVDLSHCKHITDDAVISLADGCQGLKACRLSWCPNITAGAVSALVQNCKVLQTLDLSECLRIGPEVVNNWREQKPNLHITYQKLPRLFAKQEAEAEALKELAKRRHEKRLKQVGDLNSEMALAIAVDEKHV